MIYSSNNDSPFQVQISFHKVVETLENIAASDVDYRVNYAKGLLEEVRKYPELTEGITDFSELSKHEVLVKYLLSDLFPTALTNNEIKAAAIPFNNIIFNYSARFGTILKNAGSVFDMKVRDFDDEEVYVMSCCLILKNYYKRNIEFVKPLFYDIPDKNGVLWHYRILYNVDFVEIFPNPNTKILTPEEIDLLIDNYDNYALWREKFPPGSWVLKGFGIMSLYDATIENAVSNLKTNLLGKIDYAEDIARKIELIFRSIFKVSDLELGFTAVNVDGGSFIKAPFNENLKSFILETNTFVSEELPCSHLFDSVVKEYKYLSVSDLELFLKKNPDNKLLQNFFEAGIKSFLLLPLISNNKLLGVVEIVSYQKRQLNSMNAHKMDIVMPYLQETMERFYEEVEMEIEAIIQREYTAIHPSVYWKFRQEAALHVGIKTGSELPYKQIKFENVWPLYGQIDIQNSSVFRNQIILEDLNTQIDLLSSLFEMLNKRKPIPVFESLTDNLQSFKMLLSKMLQADSESMIHDFILNECHPVLEKIRSSDSEIEALVADYFSKIDPQTHMIYKARKEYDYTLSVINKKLAAVIDLEQEKAQSLFPHYYERFKTDGVEHNLYIGASINPKFTYKTKYLKYLRLWQLVVMCHLETEYNLLRGNLKYSLDVTSLILVFNSPISIRFRMDEKRFDVDGSYNARYEVVKKRIDKANIKDTSERITKKGTIVIVYSQKHEASEYTKYIRFLQKQNYLDANVESFEVENLQGVAGLKGFRVPVNYKKNTTNFNYQELIDAFEKFEKNGI
ncbi:GAF domain-containing protein [Flavobacterium antarcticum]|uniref:GAF domain-containing protein n=1 Tax=Flavobacterium antarcticum TaxID=271155 RepID=UPI0003B3636F|nr:GAF domain-containing protein [Flavobacterium antarcticum]